jgi:hypothetical protein
MTHKSAPRRKDIVTLADLAPRHRVVGGSERRVFGVEVPMSAKKSKDLSPKSSAPVKGGMAPKLSSNDNLTLVRAAKPAKDLPANKDIKAGQKAGARRPGDWDF